MNTEERAEIINDFLASMQIFSSAMMEFMEQALKRELNEELTVSQYKLLKLVARTEAETISDIASFLNISNAASSKAVDRLVRRDVLQRREDERDRRVMHLSLTPKGKRILDRYEDAQYQTLETLFVHVKPDDFRQTSALLDRLSAALVDDDHGPDDVCFRCGIYFRDRCLLRDQTARTCYYHLHRAEKMNTKSRNDTRTR